MGITKNDRMLKSYLKKIFEIANRGDAREESYYSILEGLLKEYTESVGKKNIHITTLPKKTEAGNPDFRIWDGKQHIVGYIEAKAPTVADLDQIEDTEQLKRYLHTFPNLILTNFFEFRLYRSGTLINKVLIARPFVVHKLKTIPPVEKESDFLTLLDKFFSFSLPKVYDAKNLAIELAKRTRFLKDEVVAQELKEEEKEGRGFILGFYEAFKQYLISGLSKEEFADLYSQTITYGLFAARTRSENSFNRKLAYDNIPRTIGILRDVFKFISLEDLPPQMEWIIDDISEVLAVTDVKNILHQYFHEGKGKDPIVHFYETFLAEYDPKTREKRGVYYTPEAVVSYIVRSLHYILKEHFDRKDGFASDSVTVLDPAAGTLTFLAEASKLAVEEFVSKYGEGGKENFIKEHILKNFYGFELMMAPYAVGHLKMSFLLEELGYKLQKDDRFKLYLTNTLEMEELAQTELPGMASLSEESHLAGKVKKETPILVILGNPPYSTESFNNSQFITSLMDTYKKGLGLEKEKRIGIISDDYVKFWRFTHWKMSNCENGIIGMITKNNFLEMAVARGIRYSFMKDFAEIFILNLHGELKRDREKKEIGDENVFDIRTPVAITILVKKQKKDTELAKVYYVELLGNRDYKYKFLETHSVDTIRWQELKPEEPYYFFYPVSSVSENYKNFSSISEIFSLIGSAVKTHKNALVTDFCRYALKNRMLRFLDKQRTDEEIKVSFGIEDTNNWTLSAARRGNEFNENKIQRYEYKPFSFGYIYYENRIVARPGKRIVGNLIHSNIGLVLKKRKKKAGFHDVFVSNTLIDINMLEGQTYVCPLYVYPATDKKDLLRHTKEPEKRETNISSEVFIALSEAYEKESTPEEISYYIYGVLYSNIYRTKYAEFLKMDFPRIPFTKDYKLFSKMGEYGKRLVDLHLLKSSELDPPVAKFQGESDNKVEKLRYHEEEKRVYINQNQYFEGIIKDVWQYQIGGYLVCDKWLKDRKGRNLSLDDIKHYCNIATVLQKTMEIQKAIDNIYPEVEKETVEFDV